MNTLAYIHVLDHLPPQYTDDEEYMRWYDFWSDIANRPEDQSYEYL
jgi:hypothetical protein